MASTSVRRRETAAPPRELRLSNWPLRDEGLKSLAAVVAMVAVSIAVAVLAESPASGLLALAALALSAWRLWVPVTYEFNSQGVTQIVFGRRRRISWRKIAGYRIRRSGVWFIPQQADRQVAAPPMLYVRCGHQLEPMAAIVAFYLGPPLP